MRKPLLTLALALAAALAPHDARADEGAAERAAARRFDGLEATLDREATAARNAQTAQAWAALGIGAAATGVGVYALVEEPLRAPAVVELAVGGSFLLLGVFGLLGPAPFEDLRAELTALRRSALPPGDAVLQTESEWARRADAEHAERANAVWFGVAGCALASAAATFDLLDTSIAAHARAVGATPLLALAAGSAFFAYYEATRDGPYESGLRRYLILSPLGASGSF